LLVDVDLAGSQIKSTRLGVLANFSESYLPVVTRGPMLPQYLIDG
jgi:hypothetical protein